MKLRTRIGVSERHARQLAKAMEGGLAGLFAAGVVLVDVGVAVNAGLALAVTQLPAAIERDYEITMDAGLVLWITSAAFLHALGTVAVPGVGGSFYSSVWWWDHLTHALSSSLVAAAGYAFVRAIEVHADDVEFPPAFVFAFLLLVVLAFGVVWEVLEFAATGLGAVTGARVLTQYGLSDTMLDLVFDAVGGVVVAVWGTTYLSGTTDLIAAYFDRRRARDG